MFAWVCHLVEVLFVEEWLVVEEDVLCLSELVVWFGSVVVWDCDRVDGWLVEGWLGYAVYFHILSMWLHCVK